MSIRSFVVNLTWFQSHIDIIAADVQSRVVIGIDWIGNNTNNNNIYSFQREIKAVVRHIFSYYSFIWSTWLFSSDPCLSQSIWLMLRICYLPCPCTGERKLYLKSFFLFLKEALSPAQRRQIKDDFRGQLPAICQSIDNLNTALSFLKALGRDPFLSLHEFMNTALQMKTTILSRKVRSRWYECLCVCMHVYVYACVCACVRPCVYVNLFTVHSPLSV